MPFDAKLTMVFQGPNAGWSESWYKAGVDSVTDVLNLANRADNGLVAKRKGMLSAHYRIKGLICHNVDRTRDGLPVPITGDAGVGGWAVGPGEFAAQSLQQDDAVNMRFYNGTSFWRNVPMRGLPDVAMTARGELTTGGLYRNSINEMIRAVIDGQWCMRRGVKGAPVGLAGVTMHNQQIIQITTAAAVPDVTVASALEVEGALGLSNVNVRYRIIEIINPTTFRVVRRQRLSYGELEEGTGRVRAVNYQYPNITRGIAVNLMTRKTGRPLDESRGRALVRRS